MAQPQQRIFSQSFTDLLNEAVALPQPALQDDARN